MNALLTIVTGLIGTVIGVILTKLTENYFEKRKESKLFVADIDSVLKWGWDGKKLLRHLIALDYETTENLNEINEGTSEQWAPVFMNHPDCWKLLALHEAELVGYWCCFAMSDTAFERVKEGKLSDGEINIHNVVDIDKPGVFNIYLVMICVREHYRIKGFPILLNSFIDQLNEFTNANRVINEVCINAFSDEGRVLAKNFGLKYYCQNMEFGEMYLGSFADMKSSRLARGKLK